MQTLKLPGCIAAQEATIAAEWAPDAAHLAVRRGSAAWVTTSDGKRVAPVLLPASASQRPTFHWNETGSRLALLQGGAVHVWEPSANAATAWFEPAPGEPAAHWLAWSDADAIWLAQDERYRLLRAGRQIAAGTFGELFRQGLAPPRTNVSYSPGGRFAVEQSRARTTLLRRDGESLELLFVASETGAPVHSAVVSPRGWFAGDPEAFEALTFAKGRSLLGAAALTGRDLKAHLERPEALTRFWSEAPH